MALYLQKLLNKLLYTLRPIFSKLSSNVKNRQILTKLDSHVNQELWPLMPCESGVMALDLQKEHDSLFRVQML